MIYVETGYEGTASPLDHPRFCYQKHDATVTATNSADGADPAWLDDGETWSQWQAGSSSVTVTLTFASTQPVGYVGIAAHDLDLSGSTIALQVDEGSGFADVSGLTGIEPGDDGAILFLLGPVDADAVRLVVTGDSAPTIGVMQAGLALELPRRCTYTALPISESEQTRYRHAQAVGGAVLGRAVESAELSFAIEISNLSEDWREASGDVSWQGLTQHIRDAGPLFVASRPSRYPEDVAYGFARERPRFNRAVPNRNIAGQVSLDFLGYKRP